MDYDLTYIFERLKRQNSDGRKGSDGSDSKSEKGNQKIPKIGTERENWLRGRPAYLRPNTVPPTDCRRREFDIRTVMCIRAVRAHRGLLGISEPTQIGYDLPYTFQLPTEAKCRRMFGFRWVKSRRCKGEDEKKWKKKRGR